MRVRIIVELESYDNEVEVERSKPSRISGETVSDLYDLIDDTVNQIKNAFRDVK